MEDQQQQPSSLFGLSFDHNLKQSLKSTALVAGVAAVFGLISTVIKSAGGFLVKQSYRSFDFEGRTFQRGMSSANILGIAITLIIGILLFFYLNRFSKTASSGIDNSDQSQLNEALGSLAGYFRLLGVLLIVGISLVLLVFLVTLMSL